MKKRKEKRKKDKKRKEKQEIYKRKTISTVKDRKNVSPCNYLDIGALYGCLP